MKLMMKKTWLVQEPTVFYSFLPGLSKIQANFKNKQKITNRTIRKGFGNALNSIS